MYLLKRLLRALPYPMRKWLCTVMAHDIAIEEGHSTRWDGDEFIIQARNYGIHMPLGTILWANDENRTISIFGRDTDMRLSDITIEFTEENYERLLKIAGRHMDLRKYPKLPEYLEGA